jgi:hypothetical protein
VIDHPTRIIEPKPRVEAPFTPDQVESLNGYQVSGVMHPFTCGRCRDELGIWEDGTINDRLLVATEAGWTCPTCDNTQNWAWPWMADGSWRGHNILRTD